MRGGSRFALIGVVQAALLFLGGGGQCRKARHPHISTSLIRHFADLRDATYGGSVSRKDKEAHFEKAVRLLAPVARQVLTEMNTSLLLDTGNSQKQDCETQRMMVGWKHFGF
jgi:hypothetical protein